MNYTFFDKESGIVKFIGKFRKIEDAELTCQSVDNCGFIEGEYSSEFWVFQNNQPVRKKDEDIASVELQKQWGKLRTERDQLLENCDWTQTPDSPLSEAQQQSWRDYRQALRDLPENTTDPLNPTWPSKPS